MNTCANSSCSVNIMDSVRYCQRHKNPPKRRGKKKFGKKRNNGLFDASGKVKANMGLARLKANDRLRWEREQREMKALCLRGFLAILDMVVQEQAQAA